MGKIFKLKPRTNIANGQINLTLPKKKLSKLTLKEILNGKKIKVRLEGFE